MTTPHTPSAASITTVLRKVIHEAYRRECEVNDVDPSLNFMRWIEHTESLTDLTFIVGGNNHYKSLVSAASHHKDASNLGGGIASSTTSPMKSPLSAAAATGPKLPTAAAQATQANQYFNRAKSRFAAVSNIATGDPIAKKKLFTLLNTLKIIPSLTSLDLQHCNLMPALVSDVIDFIAETCERQQARKKMQTSLGEKDGGDNVDDEAPPASPASPYDDVFEAVAASTKMGNGKGVLTSVNLCGNKLTIMEFHRLCQLVMKFPQLESITVDTSNFYPREVLFELCIKNTAENLEALRIATEEEKKKKDLAAKAKRRNEEGEEEYDEQGRRRKRLNSNGTITHCFPFRKYNLRVSPRSWVSGAELRAFSKMLLPIDKTFKAIMSAILEGSATSTGMSGLFFQFILSDIIVTLKKAAVEFVKLEEGEIGRRLDGNNRCSVSDSGDEPFSSSPPPQNTRRLTLNLYNSSNNGNDNNSYTNAIMNHSNLLSTNLYDEEPQMVDLTEVLQNAFKRFNHWRRVQPKCEALFHIPIPNDRATANCKVCGAHCDPSTGTANDSAQKNKDESPFQNEQQTSSVSPYSPSSGASDDQSVSDHQLITYDENGVAVAPFALNATGHDNGYILMLAKALFNPSNHRIAISASYFTSLLPSRSVQEHLYNTIQNTQQQNALSPRSGGGGGGGGHRHHNNTANGSQQQQQFQGEEFVPRTGTWLYEYILAIINACSDAYSMNDADEQYILEAMATYQLGCGGGGGENSNPTTSSTSAGDAAVVKGASVIIPPSIGVNRGSGATTADAIVLLGNTMSGSAAFGTSSSAAAAAAAVDQNANSNSGSGGGLPTDIVTINMPFGDRILEPPRVRSEDCAKQFATLLCCRANNFASGVLSSATHDSLTIAANPYEKTMMASASSPMATFATAHVGNVCRHCIRTVPLPNIVDVMEECEMPLLIGGGGSAGSQNTATSRKNGGLRTYEELIEEVVYGGGNKSTLDEEEENEAACGDFESQAGNNININNTANGGEGVSNNSITASSGGGIIHVGGARNNSTTISIHRATSANNSHSRGNNSAAHNQQQQQQRNNSISIANSQATTIHDNGMAKIVGAAPWYYAETIEKDDNGNVQRKEFHFNDIVIQALATCAVEAETIENTMNSSAANNSSKTLVTGSGASRNNSIAPTASYSATNIVPPLVPSSSSSSVATALPQHGSHRQAAQQRAKLNLEAKKAVLRKFRQASIGVDDLQGLSLLAACQRTVAQLPEYSSWVDVLQRSNDPSSPSSFDLISYYLSYFRTTKSGPVRGSSIAFGIDLPLSFFSVVGEEEAESHEITLSPRFQESKRLKKRSASAGSSGNNQSQNKPIPPYIVRHEPFLVGDKTFSTIVILQHVCTFEGVPMIYGTTANGRIVLISREATNDFATRYDAVAFVNVESYHVQMGVAEKHTVKIRRAGLLMEKQKEREQQTAEGKGGRPTEEEDPFAVHKRHQKRDALIAAITRPPILRGVQNIPTALVEKSFESETLIRVLLSLRLTPPSSSLHVSSASTQSPSAATPTTADISPLCNLHYSPSADIALFVEKLLLAQELIEAACRREALKNGEPYVPCLSATDIANLKRLRDAFTVGDDDCSDDNISSGSMSSSSATSLIANNNKKQQQSNGIPPASSFSCVSAPQLQDEALLAITTNVLVGVFIKDKPLAHQWQLNIPSRSIDYLMSFMAIWEEAVEKEKQHQLKILKRGGALPTNGTASGPTNASLTSSSAANNDKDAAARQLMLLSTSASPIGVDTYDLLIEKRFPFNHLKFDGSGRNWTIPSRDGGEGESKTIADQTGLVDDSAAASASANVSAASANFYTTIATCAVTSIRQLQRGLSAYRLGSVAAIVSWARSVSPLFLEAFSSAVNRLHGHLTPIIAHTIHPSLSSVGGARSDASTSINNNTSSQAEKSQNSLTNKKKRRGDGGCGSSSIPPPTRPIILSEASVSTSGLFESFVNPDCLLLTASELLEQHHLQQKLKQQQQQQSAEKTNISSALFAGETDEEDEISKQLKNLKRGEYFVNTTPLITISEGGGGNNTKNAHLMNTTNPLNRPALRLFSDDDYPVPFIAIDAGFGVAIARFTVDLSYGGARVAPPSGGVFGGNGGNLMSVAGASVANNNDSTTTNTHLPMIQVPAGGFNNEASALTVPNIEVTPQSARSPRSPLTSPKGGASGTANLNALGANTLTVTQPTPRRQRSLSQMKAKAAASLQVNTGPISLRSASFSNISAVLGEPNSTTVNLVGQNASVTNHPQPNGGDPANNSTTTQTATPAATGNTTGHLLPYQNLQSTVAIKYNGVPTVVVEASNDGRRYIPLQSFTIGVGDNISQSLALPFKGAFRYWRLNWENVPRGCVDADGKDNFDHCPHVTRIQVSAHNQSFIDATGGSVKGSLIKGALFADSNGNTCCPSFVFPLLQRGIHKNGNLTHHLRYLVCSHQGCDEEGAEVATDECSTTTTNQLMGTIIDDSFDCYEFLTHFTRQTKTKAKFIAGSSSPKASSSSPSSILDKSSAFHKKIPLMESRFGYWSTLGNMGHTPTAAITTLSSKSVFLVSRIGPSNKLFISRCAKSSGYMIDTPTPIEEHYMFGTLPFPFRNSIDGAYPLSDSVVLIFSGFVFTLFDMSMRRTIVPTQMWHSNLPGRPMIEKNGFGNHKEIPPAESLFCFPFRYVSIMLPDLSSVNDVLMCSGSDAIRWRFPAVEDIIMYYNSPFWQINDDSPRFPAPACVLSSQAAPYLITTTNVLALVKTAIPTEAHEFKAITDLSVTFTTDLSAPTPFDHHQQQTGGGGVISSIGDDYCRFISGEDLLVFNSFDNINSSDHPFVCSPRPSRDGLVVTPPSSPFPATAGDEVGGTTAVVAIGMATNTVIKKHNPYAKEAILDSLALLHASHCEIVFRISERSALSSIIIVGASGGASLILEALPTPSEWPPKRFANPIHSNKNAALLADQNNNGNLETASMNGYAFSTASHHNNQHSGHNAANNNGKYANSAHGDWTYVARASQDAVVTVIPIPSTAFPASMFRIRTEIPTNCFSIHRILLAQRKFNENEKSVDPAIGNAHNQKSPSKSKGEHPKKNGELVTVNNTHDSIAGCPTRAPPIGLAPYALLPATLPTAVHIIDNKARIVLTAAPEETMVRGIKIHLKRPLTKAEMSALVFCVPLDACASSLPMGTSMSQAQLLQQQQPLSRVNNASASYYGSSTTNFNTASGRPTSPATSGASSASQSFTTSLVNHQQHNGGTAGPQTFTVSTSRDAAMFTPIKVALTQLEPLTSGMSIDILFDTPIIARVIALQVSPIIGSGPIGQLFNGCAAMLGSFAVYPSVCQPVLKSGPTFTGMNASSSTGTSPNGKSNNNKSHGGPRMYSIDLPVGQQCSLVRIFGALHLTGGGSPTNPNAPQFQFSAPSRTSHQNASAVNQQQQQQQCVVTVMRGERIIGSDEDEFGSLSNPVLATQTIRLDGRAEIDMTIPATALSLQGTGKLTIKVSNPFVMLETINLWYPRFPMPIAIQSLIGFEDANASTLFQNDNEISVVVGASGQSIIDTTSTNVLKRDSSSEGRLSFHPDGFISEVQTRKGSSVEEGPIVENGPTQTRRAIIAVNHHCISQFNPIGLRITAAGMLNLIASGVFSSSMSSLKMKVYGYAVTEAMGAWPIGGSSYTKLPLFSGNVPLNALRGGADSPPPHYSTSQSQDFFAMFDDLSSIKSMNVSPSAMFDFIEVEFEFDGPAVFGLLGSSLAHNASISVANTASLLAGIIASSNGGGGKINAAAPQNVGALPPLDFNALINSHIVLLVNPCHDGSSLDRAHILSSAQMSQTLSAAVLFAGRQADVPDAGEPILISLQVGAHLRFSSRNHNQPLLFSGVSVEVVGNNTNDWGPTDSVTFSVECVATVENEYAVAGYIRSDTRQPLVWIGDGSRTGVPPTTWRLVMCSHSREESMYSAFGNSNSGYNSSSKASVNVLVRFYTCPVRPQTAPFMLGPHNAAFTTNVLGKQVLADERNHLLSQVHSLSPTGPPTSRMLDLLAVEGVMEIRKSGASVINGGANSIKGNTQEPEMRSVAGGSPSTTVLYVGAQIKGEPQSFTKVSIHTLTDANHEFAIQYSDDGNNYTTVAIHSQREGWCTTQWRFCGFHNHWRVAASLLPGSVAVKRNTRKSNASSASFVQDNDNRILGALMQNVNPSALTSVQWFVALPPAVDDFSYPTQFYSHLIGNAQCQNRLRIPQHDTTLFLAFPIGFGTPRRHAAVEPKKVDYSASTANVIALEEEVKVQQAMMRVVHGKVSSLAVRSATQLEERIDESVPRLEDVFLALDKSEADRLRNAMGCPASEKFTLDNAQLFSGISTESGMPFVATSGITISDTYGGRSKPTSVRFQFTCSSMATCNNPRVVPQMIISMDAISTAEVFTVELLSNAIAAHINDPRSSEAVMNIFDFGVAYHIPMDRGAARKLSPLDQARAFARRPPIFLRSSFDTSLGSASGQFHLPDGSIIEPPYEVPIRAGCSMIVICHTFADLLRLLRQEVPRNFEASEESIVMPPFAHEEAKLAESKKASAKAEFDDDNQFLSLDNPDFITTIPSDPTKKATSTSKIPHPTDLLRVITALATPSNNIPVSITWDVCGHSPTVTATFSLPGKTLINNTVQIRPVAFTIISFIERGTTSIVADTAIILPRISTIATLAARFVTSVDESSMNFPRLIHGGIQAVSDVEKGISPDLPAVMCGHITIDTITQRPTRIGTYSPMLGSIASLVPIGPTWASHAFVSSIDPIAVGINHPMLAKDLQLFGMSAHKVLQPDPSTVKSKMASFRRLQQQISNSNGTATESDHKNLTAAGACLWNGGLHHFLLTVNTDATALSFNCGDRARLTPSLFVSGSNCHTRITNTTERGWEIHSRSDISSALITSTQTLRERRISLVLDETVAPLLCTAKSATVGGSGMNTGNIEHCDWRTEWIVPKNAAEMISNALRKDLYVKLHSSPAPSTSMIPAIQSSALIPTLSVLSIAVRGFEEPTMMVYGTLSDKVFTVFVDLRLPIVDQLTDQLQIMYPRTFIPK